MSSYLSSEGLIGPKVTYTSAFVVLPELTSLSTRYNRKAQLLKRHRIIARRPRLLSVLDIVHRSSDGCRQVGSCRRDHRAPSAPLPPSRLIPH